MYVENCWIQDIIDIDRYALYIEHFFVFNGTLDQLFDSDIRIRFGKLSFMKMINY